MEVLLMKSALYAPGAHDLWDVLVDGQTVAQREPREAALAAQAAIRRWAKNLDQAEEIARTICDEARQVEQRRLKAFFQGQRARPSRTTGSEATQALKPPGGRKRRKNGHSL